MDPMEHPEWFDTALHWVSLGAEGAGVLITVTGLIWASLSLLAGRIRGGTFDGAFRIYRTQVARAILVGLEFLVAADIIGTVAVEPTISNLLVLALIVAIRIVLGFSLELEVEGRWPWQRVRIDRGPPTESSARRGERLP